MNPTDVFADLLGRVGARQGAPVLVNEQEIHGWPDAAVEAMKSQKLLSKARLASSAVCPGCERECVMPVHTPVTTAGRSLSSFVVCDKRDDVNRVLIPAERLTQWQCSADMICGFIATSLGLRRGTSQKDNAGRWIVGKATGDKRGQTLCLQADGMLTMIVGSSKVPMAELIEFKKGKYSLDSAMVRRLVDAATMTDDRYTPSNARREARKLNTQAMYENWNKEYRQLKRRRPNMSNVWYSQQIAKMEIGHGRDAETIRKHMKK